jgi:plasmid stabilization system protein ParE
MKRFKIVWTDSALIDIKKTHSFLEKIISLEYADKVILLILSRVEQLKNYPLSGKKEPLLEDLQQDHRYLIEKHWKIIYRLIEDVVYVTDVFDTRQDPSRLNDK